MVIKHLYTQFKTRWTGRAALVLSLLYLLNPIYTPLNTVLHEVIAFFESPNTTIGHHENSNIYQGYTDDHEHETMYLERGHELVDLVALALEHSEEKKSSNESLLKNVEFDKHISITDYIIGTTNNLLQNTKYWFFEEKSRFGYPLERKVPPRLP